MSYARAALSLALIPGLLMAQTDSPPLSPSVRVLLRKPRLGANLVTQTDGTTTSGNIVRVTNQFVVFRTGTICENIELGSIAEIKEAPLKKESLTKRVAGDMLGFAFFPLLLLGYSLSWEPSDPMSGNWESIHPLQDGRFRRIWIQIGRIDRALVDIRKGRYRTNDQEVLLSFEGAPVDEEVPFRFTCASLVLETANGTRYFALQPAPKNRAEAPIVGRWIGNTDSSIDPTTWEFRVDKTFRKETSSQTEIGSSQPRPNGLHVTFRGNNSPNRDEDWRVWIKSGHLFITSGGETTEYQRVIYT